MKRLNKKSCHDGHFRALIFNYFGQHDSHSTDPFNHGAVSSHGSVARILFGPAFGFRQPRCGSIGFFNLVRSSFHEVASSAAGSILEHGRKSSLFAGPAIHLDDYGDN